MRIVAFVFLFAVSALNLAAQDTTELVKQAFNAGSAKELIRYFNKITEIKINNQSNNYSLVQAEPVIRQFFQLNPPTTFDYVHKGQSPQGLKYNIGQYRSGEQSYRVVLLLKVVDGVYVIDTLNITEE